MIDFIRSMGILSKVKFAVHLCTREIEKLLCILYLDASRPYQSNKETVGKPDSFMCSLNHENLNEC